MATNPQRRTVGYLAAAFALGPLFALGLHLEVALLGALRVSTPFLPLSLFEGFGLQLFLVNALHAGVASLLVSAWMRRRILESAERDLGVLALGSALVGGPLFSVLSFALGQWGSALPFLTRADEGWGDWALTAALGGALFGLVLGPVFLPVTWPVARLGLGLLRLVGGRASQEGAAGKPERVKEG